MTVMFCDLADSTPLAETLDPEDFRELLTDYRQACNRAIERFGGFTAVYAGDGMTVYFGYPRAHEDDAHRAVHTGLAIVEGIADLNARLHEIYDVSLEVRIGIHSGVVIAEELGGGAGETKSQLDISGEMPHIASRIESIAPRGSVAISDSTRALVEGYFETEPLGEQALKGVSRPIGVHRILGPTGAIGRLEVAAARRLTPVVGRGAELERLTEAWRQVSLGRGSVAHVTGEAGIGKSRLVHELIETLGDRVGTVQRWQCSAHYDSTSLYPVSTYLERSLGLATIDSSEEQLARLDRALGEVGVDPNEAAPLVAGLLALPGSQADGGHELAPRDARAALLHVLEALLVTNSAQHPLLLVVEDLHWADPTTVELLGRIIRALPRLPVLCVLTYRTDFEPPWTDEPSALTIELGPLTRAEVRAMVAGTTDERDPALLDWVESAADGVPLFVEEMLKLGRQPGESSVPPTLEGLLTERLDRLPELADVIDTAAILGREFDRSHLAALEPLDADLDAALVRLAADDVIRLVEGAPSRCEFAHGLLHEAAYARILRRRRRALHARVAYTFEHFFRDIVEREPEVIANHWTCADEHAKAVPFWHAAGTRALERAAFLEAAEHFRHGVEALDATGQSPDDLAHLDFLTHIAASLQAGHGYAAAGVKEAYGRAREASNDLAIPELLVPVIRGEWMFHLLRGEYATALELADEMLELGGRAPGFPTAEGHLFRGLVYMYLGKFELARQQLGEAVALYRAPIRADHIYETQGDTGVGALAYLAVVLWNLGEPDEAKQRSDESIERAEHTGGPVTRAQAWGMRSILHLSRSEPAEFGQWVQKTHAHSVDHDLGYWRIASSCLAGWLQGRMGQVELGAARLHASLDEYVASGSRLGLPQFQILAADLRRAAGDITGALDLLRTGEEYIEETGERLSETELYRFKGRLLAEGDPDAATVALKHAVAAAHEQKAKLLELQALTRLVEHQRKLGEDATDLDRIAELCAGFPPGPPLVDVERARTLLASESVAP